MQADQNKVPFAVLDIREMFYDCGGLAPPGDYAAAVFRSSNLLKIKTFITIWKHINMKKDFFGNSSFQKQSLCATEKFCVTRQEECFVFGLKWKKPHRATFYLHVSSICRSH